MLHARCTQTVTKTYDRVLPQTNTMISLWCRFTCCWRTPSPPGCASLGALTGAVICVGWVGKTTFDAPLPLSTSHHPRYGYTPCCRTSTVQLLQMFVAKCARSVDNARRRCTAIKLSLTERGSSVVCEEWSRADKIQTKSREILSETPVYDE